MGQCDSLLNFSLHPTKAALVLHGAGTSLEGGPLLQACEHCGIARYCSDKCAAAAQLSAHKLTCSRLDVGEGGCLGCCTVNEVVQHLTAATTAG